MEQIGCTNKYPNEELVTSRGHIWNFTQNIMGTELQRASTGAGKVCDIEISLIAR